MPITILYYLCVFIVMVILIINIVYPLLVPKYKLFFMFRRDKYSEAVDDLESVQRDLEVGKVRKKIDEFKGKGENE